MPRNRSAIRVGRCDVLPFENTTGKPEFNWVGESFARFRCRSAKGADAERRHERTAKIIQQRLRIRINVPAFATSLKLARDSGSTLLIERTL